MLPGTAGTVLGWAARDRPLLGAGERHPPAPAQPPWVGGTGTGEELLGVLCKWPGMATCC